MWRLWAKALGEKASKTNNEADKVAFIRTLLVLQAVITNTCIVIGILHHW
jgi:hypothetical protein